VVRRKRYQKGHLYRTGKRRQVWRARWVEPVVLANGRVGRILRNEFIAEVREVPTRRQAQSILDERLRGFNQGSHRPQAVTTFRQFVEEHWIKQVLPAFRPSTQESHRVLFRKHLLPGLGERRLCDLGTAEIQMWVTQKAKAGLAWNTVKNLRNLASRILRTAVEWRLVSSNPAHGVRLPARQLSRPPRIITIEQFRSLLAALPEPVRTMVLLCGFTGVRAGELLALRWRHIDVERGVLQVRESVHRGGFGPPKTRNSVRDLPLGNVALAALLEHRKRSRQGRPEDLIFPSRKGTALCRDNLLKRIVYPACERAKIPKIGWHSLRHLHATLLSKAGQPLKVAQAQLGHADLQTTLGIYTHVLPESQRRAVEKIETLTFPNFPKLAEDESRAGHGASKIQ
jgi:integrase